MHCSKYHSNLPSRPMLNLAQDHFKLWYVDVCVEKGDGLRWIMEKVSYNWLS